MLDLQNITAFLMSQNRQFEDAVNALKYARQNLDPARFVGAIIRSQFVY
jgi:hypothetical protein